MPEHITPDGEPMTDDLPEFFEGQLQTIESLRSDNDRLRRHLRLAAHDLEQAGRHGEARLARLEAGR